MKRRNFFWVFIFSLATIFSGCNFHTFESGKVYICNETCNPDIIIEEIYCQDVDDSGQKSHYSVKLRDGQKYSVNLPVGYWQISIKYYDESTDEYYDAKTSKINPKQIESAETYYLIFDDGYNLSFSDYVDSDSDSGVIRLYNDTWDSDIVITDVWVWKVGYDNYKKHKEVSICNNKDFPIYVSTGRWVVEICYYDYSSREYFLARTSENSPKKIDKGETVWLILDDGFNLNFDN